jgi:hypothetical protein
MTAAASAPSASGPACGLSCSIARAAARWPLSLLMTSYHRPSCAARKPRLRGACLVLGRRGLLPGAKGGCRAFPFPFRCFRWGRPVGCDRLPVRCASAVLLTEAAYALERAWVLWGLRSAAQFSAPARGCALLVWIATSRAAWGALWRAIAPVRGASPAPRGLLALVDVPPTLAALGPRLTRASRSAPVPLERMDSRAAPVPLAALVPGTGSATRAVVAALWSKM